MTFFNFNSLKVPTRFNLLLETTELKQFFFIINIKRVDTKMSLKVQSHKLLYVSKLLQLPT